MGKNLNELMLKIYVKTSTKLKETFERDLKNERGAVAVEYGLVIALVVAVVVAAAYVLRAPLEDFFQTAVQTIKGWMTGASSPST